MSNYKEFMTALMPHASSNPMEIDPTEYQNLVQLKQNGWSVCQSEKEWLVKLHYLRHGFKEGKIDETAFLEREKTLVLNWWKRFL